MSIIFKFVIKNIKSNRFRTFLIIFSICVSTALFFASMAISSTMESMYLERMKMYYGSSEIIIYSGPDSPSSFVEPYEAKNCEGIDYVAGMLQSGGYYSPDAEELVRLSVKAVSYEDLMKLKAFTPYGKEDIEPFSGSKLIIGKSMADKYNLSVGDIIDIEVAGFKRKFRICAVSEPVGFFIENGNYVSVVAPLNTISSLYGVKGRFTELYIKLKDPGKLNEALSALSQAYKRYTVRETISQAQLKSASSDISTPFIMMTGIVMFMSIFIMYSSYKVIIAERLPIIGTFRSIGATRRSTNFVLMFESITYGITGGLLGCILGVGVLFIMAKFIMPSWAAGLGLKISFTMFQFVAAFILAMTLSIASSFFPIRKAAKASVKDIIFASSAKSPTYKRWKVMLGVPLFIVSVTVPPFLPKALVLPIGFACMVFSTMSIVLLIPYMTALLLKLFERLYCRVFGNEGVLAAKNLRQNKSITNNIALLAIGISSILMINTVSASVITEVTSFYKNMEFDVFFWASQADKNVLNMVRGVEGVEGVYGVYESNGLSVNNSNERISLLQGIDINKFPEFISIDFGRDRDEILKELDEGRNVLLGEKLRDQLLVKEGDILAIEMPKGIRNYKIKGFFNTLMYNGSYAIISEKYYKADTGDRYYSEIYVKASQNPEKVAEELKSKFSRRQPWVMTMKESEKRDKEANKMMFDIMAAFSIAAMVIGLFGVLNNYTISFIERKRHLAMYRSMGMSKAQMIKMILIEALTGGMVGGSMGAVGGIILIYIIPYIIKYIAADIRMHYSISLISFCVLTGMIISIVASLSPALKSSRLSIIDNIKYE